MTKLSLLHSGRQRKEDMKVRYSEDVDILLLELSKDPIDYAEEVGNAVLHYSPKKKLVLIEVMHASSIFKSLLKEAKRVLPEDVRKRILVS